MKVVDRYILREFLLPLLAGLGLVMAFLVVERLFDLMDLVLNRGIDVRIVLKLVTCLLPSIVAVALPMATLLATVLAFGRQAHDRELLAFKGAGVSLGRLTAPLVVMGFFFSLILVVFNGSVLPNATAAYKRLFISIIRQRATVAFQERVFVREFDRYLLYFNTKEGTEGTLKDVYIIESPPRPPRVITAQRGRLQVDPDGFAVKLVLENGTVDQPADRTGEHYTRITFAHYEVNLDIRDALRGSRLSVKGMDEMTYGDLIDKIKALRRSSEERRSYEAVLHQRLALACAPLFVVFIGAPLGALARRGGGLGVLLSLFVIFAYYSMLMLGHGFADRNVLPPWLALWIPNLFLAAPGALAFWVASREARWMRWGR